MAKVLPLINNKISKVIFLAFAIFYLAYNVSYAQKEAENQQAQQPQNEQDDPSLQVQENAGQADSPSTETNNKDSVTVTTDDSPAQNDATQSSSTDPKNLTNNVILQALNKITARTSRINAAIGEPVKFGNLSVILRACWKSPPEEEPESKALLEIWEETPDEPRSKVFSGWMFASSPLISAPEHPVYDITIIECTNDSTVGK